MLVEGPAEGSRTVATLVRGRFGPRAFPFFPCFWPCAGGGSAKGSELAMIWPWVPEATQRLLEGQEAAKSPLPSR